LFEDRFYVIAHSWKCIPICRLGSMCLAERGDAGIGLKLLAKTDSRNQSGSQPPQRAASPITGFDSFLLFVVKCL
jgi:hypothetical protein